MHLKSALAVWSYCEASAKELFSGRGIYKLDDKILSFLESENLTLTQINSKLGRNIKSQEIKSALQRLIDAKIVQFEVQNSGGRPTTIFSTAKLNCTK